MTGHTGGEPDYCPGCRVDPPAFPQCPGPQEDTAMKYRKLPVEIEAITWTGDNVDEAKTFLGHDFAGTKPVVDGVYLLIHTLENPENPFHAPPGWMVIEGVKGEHYACAPDIFDATYEPTR